MTGVKNMQIEPGGVCGEQVVCGEQTGESGEVAGTQEVNMGETDGENVSVEMMELAVKTRTVGNSTKGKNVVRAKVGRHTRQVTKTESTDSDGWLSESSEAPTTSDAVYSAKMIRTYLRKTKGLRKVKLEIFFSDKEQSCASAGLHIKSGEKVSPEKYRLQKTKLREVGKTLWK